MFHAPLNVSRACVFDVSPNSVSTELQIDQTSRRVRELAPKMHPHACLLQTSLYTNTLGIHCLTKSSVESALHHSIHPRVLEHLGHRVHGAPPPHHVVANDVITEGFGHEVEQARVADVCVRRVVYLLPASAVRAVDARAIAVRSLASPIPLTPHRQRWCRAVGDVVFERSSMDAPVPALVSATSCSSATPWTPLRGSAGHADREKQLNPTPSIPAAYRSSRLCRYSHSTRALRGPCPVRWDSG